MIRLANARLTRIVCEVDEDALLAQDTLAEMIKEGMDIALLQARGQNYPTLENLKRRIDDAAAHVPTIIGTILTIPGPVRQVYSIPVSPLQIHSGQTLSLVLEVGEEEDSYAVLSSLQGLECGQTVVFGPNQLTAVVTQVESGRVKLQTTTDGQVQLQSRVYVDGSSAFDTNFTEKQLSDIDFGLSLQFNFLSVCFSEHFAEELEMLRERVGKRKTKLLARVERMLDREELTALVDMCDGIILERSALEVQMQIEKLCTYKKLVVQTCALYGKPILVSGHVLGSLQSLPYPLRADACDVYNGVMDGSDGFVLSGLVLTPDLWKNSLLMMKNIVASAEKNLKGVTPPSWTGSETPSILEALASSAVKTSLDLRSRYLITVLHKNQAARLLAKYKPKVPILVLGNDLRVLEQSLIYRGTVPMLADVSEHRRLLAAKTMELKTAGLVQETQSMVVLSEKNSRSVASFQAILSVIAVE